MTWTQGARIRVMELVVALGMTMVVFAAPGVTRADEWTFYTESNFVLDLAVDAGGMWAATPGGVLRYRPDGTVSEHITRAGGLPMNPTQAIAVDALGDLWIGTLGAGVVRRRAGNGDVWEYGLAEGLYDGQVTTIQPVDGGVWVGTIGGVTKFVGDSRIAEGRNRFSSASGLPADSVLAVIEFNGSTWFGTSRALAELDPDAGFIEHLTGELVRVLETDASGRLIAATDSTVYRWNTTAWETLDTGLATELRDLTAVGDTLWAAVAGPNGVMRFADSTWVIANEGLPVGGVAGWSSARAIDYDADGGLWVGTERGIAKRVGDTWLRSQSVGLPSNAIISMTQDSEGGAWYLTGSDNNLFPPIPEPWGGNRGMSRYHDGEWRPYFRPPDSLASNNTYRAIERVPGEMWIATWQRGLSRLDLASGTFTTYRAASGPGSEFIPDVTVDGQGNLWAASYEHGVVSLHDSTWTHYLPGNGLPAFAAYIYPRTIAARGNILWVGTYAIDVSGFGIARIDTRGTPLDPDDDLVIHFSPSTSGWGAVSGTVNDLFIDPDGTVWAGTSSGVARYTGSSWNTYTVAEQGQAMGEVRAIARDHAGNHWFATRNGLSRLAADGTTWKTFRAATSLLPLDDVMSVMVENETGDILAATWGGGVARIHVTSPVTAVEKTEQLVVGPNPYRPSADGDLTFPDLDPAAVVRIYSMSGELLRTLPASAAKSWDGRDEGGKAVASGAYIVVGEEPDGMVRRTIVAVLH